MGFVFTQHYLSQDKTLSIRSETSVVFLSDLDLHGWLNSLPNDKFLAWSKLKAFADDKINVKEILKCCLGRVENIVRKEAIACYQHFLLFIQCFQKPSLSG